MFELRDQYLDTVNKIKGQGSKVIESDLSVLNFVFFSCFKDEFSFSHFLLYIEENLIHYYFIMI